MRLFQFRDNQYLNLDAIESVRVISNDVHEDEVGKPRKKIEETLTIIVTMISSEKHSVTKPQSHTLHDLLFPEESEKAGDRE